MGEEGEEGRRGRRRTNGTRGTREEDTKITVDVRLGDTREWIKSNKNILLWAYDVEMSIELQS